MAAPAFRALASKSEAVGGTTLVVNKPAGTVEGDLLVAVVSAYRESDTFSISGFTSRQSKNEGSGQTLQRLHVFTKVAGASEPSTYTVATTGAEIDGNVVILAYVSAAYDVSAGQADIGLTDQFTVTGPTTGFNNETLIFVQATTDANKTFTPPSGYTQRSEVGDSSVSSRVEISDNTKAVAGAVGDVTGTLSSANASFNRGAVVILGIKSTAVAGGGSGALAPCMTTC